MDLKDVIKFILPPRDPSPEAIEAWRLSIFLAVVALGTMLIVHVLWTIGHIGEDNGFIVKSEYRSRANEVDDRFNTLAMQITVHSKKIDTNEARRLQSEIRNLRSEQCEAIRDDNNDATRATGRLIQDRQSTYTDLTGRAYPIPTCRETGVNIE